MFAQSYRTTTDLAALSRLDLLTYVFGAAGSTGANEDTPALIDAEDPSRSLSINQARVIVRKMVAGLKAFGLKQGDTVCIHATNDIMYPPIALGIVGAGGIYAGSNPAYKVDELTHQFHTAKPRFIITNPGLISTVLQAVNASGLQDCTAFVLGQSPFFSAEYRAFDELLLHGESDWVTFQTEEQAKSTPAGYFTTSGTTGRPKLAIRTHSNFVHESTMQKDVQKKPYKVSRLISLPLFHAFACPIGIIAPLHEGIPTLIMRRYIPDTYLALLDKFNITESIAAPPMILGWLAMPDNKKASLKRLHQVTCAGAALAKSIQQEASFLLAPEGRLVQCWGMTEAGQITGFKYPDSDYSGAVGKPLPHIQVKIVDDDLREIAPSDANATGEIVIRSPAVMKGYHENPTATQEAFLPSDPTWLRTGDVGMYRNGMVYLTDRVKDLIKVKGWQVAPVEIEAVLLQHKEIPDAAVFGVADADGMNERVYVKAIRSPGSSLTPEAVKAFLLQHLASYKVGGAVIGFVDAIPRNPSGKILKRVLKDEVIRQREQASKA
ncbi:amp dependent CoA ligase [Phyllosticta citricarpa]|uniref:Amp dependent CoA ligase n=1 Tax=Phyllosticta citricarpa TaxID=55181 RepID=A0ABR1L4I1_9PEZI